MSWRSRSRRACWAADRRWARSTIRCRMPSPRIHAVTARHAESGPVAPAAPTRSSECPRASSRSWASMAAVDIPGVGCTVTTADAGAWARTRVWVTCASSSRSSSTVTGASSAGARCSAGPPPVVENVPSPAAAGHLRELVSSPRSSKAASRSAAACRSARASASTTSRPPNTLLGTRTSVFDHEGGGTDIETGIATDIPAGNLTL